MDGVWSRKRDQKTEDELCHAQRADRAGSDGSAGWTHEPCVPISGCFMAGSGSPGQDLFANAYTQNDVMSRFGEAKFGTVKTEPLP